MKLKNTRCLLVGLFIGFTQITSAFAATVLPLDSGWFQKSGTGPTVVSDARFTSGSALSYTASSNVPLFGTFGATYSLVNVGDHVTISFEYLGVTGASIIFGLVSKDTSTGSTTRIAANGATGFSDQGGYFGRIPIGSSSFTRIYKDAGVAGTGLMAGSDFTAVGTDGSNANYSSSSVQILSLTVERTATGTVTYYSLNGTEILRRTDDSAGAIYTFDGIGINHFNASESYLLGNSTVDGVYTVVPEPTTIALLIGSFSLLLLTSQRRIYRTSVLR